MIARVRSLCVTVILLVPLTVTTGANVASASGSSTPTVTTVIGLAQTCQSTGETCMPMSTAQSFISSSPLTVVFTLDAVHCSNVAVKLFVDGAASVTTPFSDPGKNTEKAVVPWPNDGKAHVLGYEGFGEVGGCNEGNLITWSGSLSVTYVPLKSAALSVSVKLARSTIAQGSQVEATATVGASGGSVSSITLGDGLTSSDDTIASVAPVSPGGFSLGDGSSKKFTFTVKAVAVGSVQLTLNASGTTSSGANVQASGQATLNVAKGFLFGITSIARPSSAVIPEGTHLPIAPPPSPGDPLAVGDKVTYTLEQWKPDGGPISISWDGKQIASLPVGPTGGVQNTLEIKGFDQWPIRGTASDPKACQGTLVAKQGDVEKKLDLESLVQGEIIYNEGTKYPLQAGDLYCDGETPPVAADGVIVYTTPPHPGPKNLNDGSVPNFHQDALPDFKSATNSHPSPGFYLTIDDSLRDIYVDYAVAYQNGLVCARLSSSNWLQVSVPEPGVINSTVIASPCPTVTRSAVLANLASMNDANDLGVRVVTGSEQKNIRALDSNYFAGQAETFSGQVTLDYGYLYVKGDATLDAGLAGEGSIISEGNIVIKGSTHDKDPERGLDLNDGLVHLNSIGLFANGNLILWGTDSERPPSG